jgi:signal transduction histidine kinase
MSIMLCVDNNPQQFAQIKKDLSLLSSLTLIQATSLQQAEKLITENNSHISLILCSQTLKDGDPLDLFKHCQFKLSRKIIYSASPSLQKLIKATNQGHVDYFLQLPYQPQAFRQIIQEQIIEYTKNNLESDKFTETMINKKLLSDPKQLRESIGFKEQLQDYSLYSDNELSTMVIEPLYKLLENNNKNNAIHRYSANHILTKEGEQNRFLWFITEGEVLSKKRDRRGEDHDISIMQVGSMIGGMSFITEKPAFSTVITLMDSTILKIDNTIFSQIMHSTPSLFSPFVNLLLRDFSRKLQHSIATELALQESMESLDVAYKKLIESEKMAVLGQLVAGVAHELNNPISAILRGSDTLTVLISELLKNASNSPFSQLAQRTLQQALTVQPLSTIEVRQRTNAMLTHVADKSLARQLVNMNLDVQEIPLEHNRNLSESINLLNEFYKAGTILRNSSSCAARIADLVKSLKHYSGQDSSAPETINIHDGIEETLIIFENKLKNYNIFKDYQQLPQIECHPIELEQVWTNIIANAIDATAGCGAINISSRYLPDHSEGSVQVIIEDDGPGIPEHIVDKIFELNYTTKRKGNFGLGIGLTICSQIIKRHHGSIEIESQPGVSTRFIITLPIANPHIENETSLFLHRAQEA